MNLIVAVDENWAIGYNNELLVSIPDDMKFFRETTTGKVVIMGRKTLESFPGGRPLKNRVNIVITKKEDYEVDGAVVVHSVEEAVNEASKLCFHTAIQLMKHILIRHIQQILSYLIWIKRLTGFWLMKVTKILILILNISLEHIKENNY